jgi:hypothetical protein
MVLGWHVKSIDIRPTLLNFAGEVPGSYPGKQSSIL